MMWVGLIGVGTRFTTDNLNTKVVAQQLVSLCRTEMHTNPASAIPTHHANAVYKLTAPLFSIRHYQYKDSKVS